jgi:signal peptidase II
VSALDGHLRLILAENRGAFLSLGADLDPLVRAVLFNGCVALALIGGLIWVIAHEHPFSELIPLSLILGGGTGNLIDRLSRSGAVSDFIFVRFGPLRTGIFNLADAFITTGVIALLVLGVLRRRVAAPPGTSPSS